MDQSWACDLVSGLLCMCLKKFCTQLQEMRNLIFASLLQQNLPDDGPWQLQTCLLGMQSHCLDPYGCDGSVMSMWFGLWVALHGFEKVLTTDEKADFCLSSAAKSAWWWAMGAANRSVRHVKPLFGPIWMWWISHEHVILQWPVTCKRSFCDFKFFENFIFEVTRRQYGEMEAVISQPILQVE